jgi:hypothetical protein
MIIKLWAVNPPISEKKERSLMMKCIREKKIPTNPHPTKKRSLGYGDLTINLDKNTMKLNHLGIVDGFVLQYSRKVGEFIAA